MEKNCEQHLQQLVQRYDVLNQVKQEIWNGYRLLANSFEQGGKLLVAGNGGSASDAEHIVGELMKGFLLSRTLDETYARKLRQIDEEMGSVLAERLQGALPAIALGAHTALSTAYSNDCDSMLCFAQQVNGYGRAEDVFFGISTSGNSRNILYAAVTAKAKGMKVLALTGEAESTLSGLADVCIRVPASQTYQVQELHLPVYHTLCMMLEEHFFG